MKRFLSLFLALYKMEKLSWFLEKNILLQTNFMYMKNSLILIKYILKEKCYLIKESYGKKRFIIGYIHKSNAPPSQLCKKSP